MGQKVLRSMMAIDVRDILPSIHVPTLVIHRTGDGIAPVEGGRMLAEQIEGARMVELDEQDHLPFAGDFERIGDEVEEFLTGTRRHTSSDRVLATVLFTDIVDSTRQASEQGDRRWRDLLDRHDELVRRQLDRFRGREVKTLGDGFLATFDGPARGVECACAIRDGVHPLGIEVRAGLHTGECEVTEADVSGMAVNIGARVGGLAARERSAGFEHGQGPHGGRGSRLLRPGRARPQGRAGELEARLSRLELRVDRAEQLRVVRLDRGVEALDRAALAAQQVLVEVEGRLAEIGR